MSRWRLAASLPATVPFACMKGDLLGKRSKKPQPPWAMLSFVVNVMRLVMYLIKHPLVF
jgi:hypothetical protein